MTLHGQESSGMIATEAAGQASDSRGHTSETSSAEENSQPGILHVPDAGTTFPPAAAAAPEDLIGALRAELEPQGFECHPLLVGWYNAHVAAGFQLPQPAATLGCVIVSTPDMFERCFVPYLRAGGGGGGEPRGRRDPLDACMRRVLGAAAARVHPASRVLHDFELGPSRRPRVLVQTAGHVSGAVRLYRREELQSDPWPGRPVCGVCLHARYGGWFALRALVVLDGVEAPHLPCVQPPEILSSDAQKQELLELFNWHWRDWRYRDVSGARETYSPLQRRYFATPPGQRARLVDRIVSGELPEAQGRIVSGELPEAEGSGGDEEGSVRDLGHDGTVGEEGCDGNGSRENSV